MKWEQLGVIAAIAGAMTVVIPYLVKLFVGPLVDEKVRAMLATLDTRFKYLEERFDNHLENHSRNRR